MKPNPPRPSTKKPKDVPLQKGGVVIKMSKPDDKRNLKEEVKMQKMAKKDDPTQREWQVDN